MANEYLDYAGLQRYTAGLKLRMDARYGAPLVAATAAAMTDTDRVYVYTGSETGYSTGHWYYYDGDSWEDGGVYQSSGVQTDTTLSIAGEAADAKATGDVLTHKVDIAPDFSAEKPYPVGAYVYYDGTLYRFTSAHAAGAWTGTDAVAAVMGTDAGYNRYALDNIDASLYPTPRLSSAGLYGLIAESGMYLGTGSLFASNKYVRTVFQAYGAATSIMWTLGLPEYEWHSWSYQSGNSSNPQPTHSNTGGRYINGANPLYIQKLSDNDKYFLVSVRRVDQAALTTDASDPTSDVYKIQHALAAYRPIGTDTTLAVSGTPADAEATGIAVKKGTMETQIGTAQWFQGTISSSGALTDSTTACRSKVLVGYDTAVFIEGTVADGYEAEIFEYNAQQAIPDNFVRILIPFTAGSFAFSPITGHMYRVVVRKADLSEITPESLPEGVVTFDIYSSQTSDGETLATAMSMINTIAADGDSDVAEWEQGTISYSTGAESSADNRIRTKYFLTYNSLKYLYINCPEGYLVGVRKYEQSDVATFLGYIGWKTGLQLINHVEGTMYKLVLKRDDDEPIAPSELPEGFEIIPVFLPYWSKNAHGNSVATITTKRSNPTYVSQIVGVSKTYYDHRDDKTGDVRDMVYGYDTAVRQDTYTNEIDCSTYVGLILRGLPYEDTQYYTHVDTPAASVVANPDYVWSLNPQYYDYYSGDLTAEPDDATRASQLGEWMIDMGWRVPKDKHLLNLEPGDIIFWSRLAPGGAAISQPDRFMSINHVGICVAKTPTVAGDGYYEGGFKYKHTLREVASATPCVRERIVEDGWDTPSVIDANNYNTISLICRPDLGSI